MRRTFRIPHSTIFAVVLAVALTGVPAASAAGTEAGTEAGTPTGAAARAAGQDIGAALERSVVDAMLARTGKDRATLAASGRAVQVNAKREDTKQDTKQDTKDARPKWVFGSAVLTAPHDAGAYPEGWLFLARRAGDAWTVGLDDTRLFGSLAANAPPTVLHADERAVFHAYRGGAAGNGDVGIQATNSYTTELTLPFAVGQSWRLTGGPHGSGGVWNSLDLAGGDGNVRAAGSGNIYTMCGNNLGWLRIYHPNGYTSDYYHLWNNIKPADGSRISAGAYLGDIGTDVSCGGSATGPHVHWGILKGGTRVPWHLRSAGKWVFFNGGSQYGGYALHGSRRVSVGGYVYNYGALRQNQGMVDTNGGGTLNKRSGPGTNYPVVGSLSDGATVNLSCWHPGGTSHTGRYETTDVWDRLTDGTWVSDAYIYSGMVYVGPRC